MFWESFRYSISSENNFFSFKKNDIFTQKTKNQTKYTKNNIYYKILVLFSFMIYHDAIWIKIKCTILSICIKYRENSLPRYFSLNYVTDENKTNQQHCHHDKYICLHQLILVDLIQAGKNTTLTKVPSNLNACSSSFRAPQFNQHSTSRREKRLSAPSALFMSDNLALNILLNYRVDKSGDCCLECINRVETGVTDYFNSL